MGLTCLWLKDELVLSCSLVLVVWWTLGVRQNVKTLSSPLDVIAATRAACDLT